MDMQVVKQSRADVEAMLLDVIPHLRAFARSLTRNRDQADDLTHDAVVRALAAIDQFTPGTNFKAWMFTILRNLYYNECRKRWTNRRLDRSRWSATSRRSVPPRNPASSSTISVAPSGN